MIKQLENENKITNASVIGKFPVKNEWPRSWNASLSLWEGEMVS